MTELTIKLIPADEEPHYKEPDRQTVLEKFQSDIKPSGKVMPEVFMQKSIDPASWLTGVFFIEALKVATPLGTALIAYLAGLKGRKVSVKFDGIEIEAASPKQVGELLSAIEKSRSKLEKP